MKIIKRGLSTFLKGLKYYLTPFGAMMLFFLIGLCIAIPNIISSVTDMIKDISEILGGMTINWEAAGNAMVSDVTVLDWGNDLMGSINKFVDGEFLKKVLMDGVNGAFGGVDYIEEIMNVIENCVSMIIMQVVLVFALTTIGLLVGFIITRMLIRHEVASVGKAFWKLLVRALLDALVFIIIIGIILSLLGSVSSGLLWLAIVGIFILYTILVVLKSYLLFGIKKVSLWQVVHPLHILYLYIADIIILALSAGFIMLCYGVLNIGIAITIAVPLVMIVLITVDLNTESYVMGIVKEGKPAQIEEKSA